MNRPAVGYLLAAVTLAILALTWGSFFAPVEHTSFGVAKVADGANARVTRVVSGSSADRAGIRPGDVVDLGALNLSDRYRLQVDRSPVGTPLTVTIIGSGQPRSVTLHAQRETILPLKTDWIAATLAGATVALLIIALIVARRPSLATAALVLYGAGAGQSFPFIAEFSWIPNPLFGAVAALLNLVNAGLPICALLPFVVRFPEAPQTPAARMTARAADTIFFLAVVVIGIQMIYEPLVFLTWGGFDAWSLYIELGLVFVFAAIGYQRSSGEQRRRIAWVLIGLLVAAIGYTAFAVLDVAILGAGGFLGAPQQLGTVIQAGADVCLLLQAALPVALGYAILRHRVLDIGFALNRTLVYGVMTALVVIVVSLVDWLTNRILSEERLALAVEALVTIGFGVALNWIHSRTERLIDRVVFRARHLAEKRIEYRIGALDFASTDAFVDDAVAAEAPRILALQSAAVFRRVAGGEPFRRTAAAGWSARDASEIGEDSLLVTTLRSLERAIVLEDVAIQDDRFPQGSTAPALAIPIISQHDLIGFALFGNRRDGALPDPEEIALLVRLCRAAGGSYAMVEARRWREHAADLERSMAAMTPL
ncbi:MAG TPA: GAF domain-containing protein [Candidatus Baltobacteraceae bacterium]|nr:GAF domain-containing protein [Candidatus Baltobacteraceae bacterium]